ncbi:UNKNOWN [Stylonychia lemnae]|uniref:Uncharacterized protein n=1 Tax=Stylonychia lemnae TaxID=5949 RepID=A0A078B272_STYLE|nr:UNKNOWN [Stylonychia lemnae]|eukprot:CDW88584.1 UNKNOWN [Stylonychia lemnae]
MAQINKLFYLPEPPHPTHNQYMPFSFTPKLPSKYITQNILSYAYLKESSYRILSSLNFDSYAFMRIQKPQFHQIGNGLGDLEFDEIENNLGRDYNENHKASVNDLIDFDVNQFISLSADCMLKVWTKPKENKEEFRYQKDMAYLMSQKIECVYSYIEKYPFLKGVRGSDDVLIILKYVNTIEVMKVHKDQNTGYINKLEPMRNYYSPYQTKIQNMISFKIDSQIQFITLYENGVLPIYKIDQNDLTQPIEQFFKIEFQSCTTDVQLLRITGKYSVQLVVSLIENEYLTSMNVLNYNWENRVSKYYQIIIDIPLNSSPFPVDRIKILNDHQFLAISRRDIDFIEFNYGRDSEIDYKSYEVHTSQIGGGYYEQVLSSVLVSLPQYYYNSKKRPQLFEISSDQLDKQDKPQVAKRPFEDIMNEYVDNYLHPYTLLNVGFDRRLTLVKINDKSRLKSCKIKVFKQTSHYYQVNSVLQLTENLFICASQDGRLTLHELKQQ